MFLYKWGNGAWKKHVSRPKWCIWESVQFRFPGGMGHFQGALAYHKKGAKLGYRPYFLTTNHLLIALPEKTVLLGGKQRLAQKISITPWFLPTHIFLLSLSYVAFMLHCDYLSYRLTARIQGIHM